MSEQRGRKGKAGAAGPAAASGDRKKRPAAAKAATGAKNIRAAGRATAGRSKGRHAGAGSEGARSEAPPPGGTGTPDMTEARALAERFLDLWQRQATAMMDDPAVARGMAQWLAQVPMMTGMAAAASGHGASGHGVSGHAASGGDGDTGEDRQESDLGARAEGNAEGSGDGPGHTAGPAAMAGAAAASPGPEQPDPGELLRRLAACEERLDRLETGLPKRRR